MSFARWLDRHGEALQWLSTGLLYLLVILVMALAAFPALYGLVSFERISRDFSPVSRATGFALLLPAGYFVYGFGTMVMAVLLRHLLFLRLSEGRYPIYSLAALRWATFNGLILIVRYTFMNFLRVTPLLVLFYRLMGARIGRRVQINSTILADCPLIEIGDETVIGGDATLIAHSAEGRELVIRKSRIGSRVTIGLNAVLLPGVTIEDGAVVAAGAVVTKGTQIGPGELWGGVPARKIETSR